LPAGWSGPGDTQARADFKEAGCPTSRIFSFTLHAKTGTKREGELAADQLIFNFAQEEQYSAWFDYLQNRMESSVSMSQVQLSSHSLFQVYSLLAINHGISSIEREMSSYQPPLPPLPSHNYCDSEPNVPARSVRQFISRRPTWIECMDSPADDMMSDIDLDRIVDDKLKQSQARGHSSDSEETLNATREVDEESATEKESHPSRDRSGGWIRANTGRPRRNFLSPQNGNK